MGTTNISIKTHVHAALKEMRENLDINSFSDLFTLLMENYLNAPPGVPVDVFNQKRDKYLGSYPDEFFEAARLCLGITDPEGFEVVFEEVIRDLIKNAETIPVEQMILQCKCGHVWKYTGKHTSVQKIHCPVCGSSGSKKWLKELRPLDQPSTRQTKPIAEDSSLPG